jgi:hypothetical protein
MVTTRRVDADRSSNTLGRRGKLTLTFLALQALHPVLVFRCDLRIAGGPAPSVLGREPEVSIG